MAASVFNARLAQTNLVAKTDFDAQLSSVKRKITENKTKHLLVKNEFKKLKTFYSSYFRRKSHFEEDGTQNYLVLQPMYSNFFKQLIILIIFISWKSKGFSDFPALSYLNAKTREEFRGTCLKQDKITCSYGKIVNIYMVYELAGFSSHSDDPTLRTNETRHIEWHETCKCKCRLDTSVCNNKQR